MSMFSTLAMIPLELSTLFTMTSLSIMRRGFPPRQYERLVRFEEVFPFCLVLLRIIFYLFVSCTPFFRLFTREFSLFLGLHNFSNSSYQQPKECRTRFTHLTRSFLSFISLSFIYLVSVLLMFIVALNFAYPVFSNEIRPLL